MSPTDQLVQSFLKIFNSYDSKRVDIPGRPVPASRPRVSKWGTYYGKTYTQWRKVASVALEESRDRFEGQLAVLTQIVSPRPKTTNRGYPRGDIDNFEKSAWDAVTSSMAAWKDDDQLVTTVTTKRYAEGDEECGIFMTIYEIEP